jgi:hypothetical protein
MANTTGNKFGGRKKGTPNRLTKETRMLFKNFIYNEIENIEPLLNELEPQKRLEIIIKLLPYALPKIETVSHSTHEPFDLEIF